MDLQTNRIINTLINILFPGSTSDCWDWCKSHKSMGFTSFCNKWGGWLMPSRGQSTPSYVSKTGKINCVLGHVHLLPLIMRESRLQGEDLSQTYLILLISSAGVLPEAKWGHPFSRLKLLVHVHKVLWLIHTPTALLNSWLYPKFIAVPIMLTYEQPPQLPLKVSPSPHPPTSMKSNWKSVSQVEISTSRCGEISSSHCHGSSWLCWSEPRQHHAVAHTPGPSISSPPIPRHHLSPSDCVGVAMPDQCQPPLSIKGSNNRHKELWKKLLFNVQKVYIQFQHVISVLMM